MLLYAVDISAALNDTIIIINKRRHFEALFVINVFIGTKCCPSVLETVDIRDPTRNIRNFSMFSCSFSHCPSSRRVSAANAVCICTDIFSNACLKVKSLITYIFVRFCYVSYLFCSVLSYCCCCLNSY
jgi:hypothetical protein